MIHFHEGIIGNACLLEIISNFYLGFFFFFSFFFLRNPTKPVLLNPWFSDSDRSMNRKREMFKLFKVGLRSNRDDVIINLIINYNINKYIKLIKIEKLPKIVPNIYIYIFEK